MARLRSPNNMAFAHRVAPVGIASVGWFAPSDRLSFGQLVHIIGSTFVLVAALHGAPLETPVVTMLTCAAMLVFGLPHGTFDIELIRQQHADKRTVAILAIYLACAAIMYGAWQIAPALALIVFFGLSIVHFAEDWTDKVPPFLAHGTATAVLTSPAFLHQGSLAELFSLLVGNDASEFFVATAVVVAPISLAIAAVAMIAMWHDGHRALAIATAVAVSAMIFLPTIVGFALFFCLMHSPAQFAGAQRTLKRQKVRQWAPVAVPLTCLALTIAALIFTSLETATLSGAMVITAFTTLSVLTLPHMAAPLFVSRFFRATA